MQKVVCVLGMHRSGTSCLIASLEEAGLFLGDVSREDPHNRKGNHENRKIMRLHEALLDFNGGRWDTPPIELVWADEHIVQRDEIIHSYSGASYWGFKDPRTLITLDGWLKGIPNLEMVGIFRHPAQVAKSLQVRDGFSLEKGLNLWINYNRRLLHYYAKYKFPIISFDTSEVQFKVKLSRMLTLCDLPINPEQFKFFDSSLRTALELDESASNYVADDLYSSLLRVSL